MSSYYRAQLEQYLRGLTVSARRVLDVGGAQLPVKGRTRSWHAENYTILDLPTPHKGAPGTLSADLNEDQRQLTAYQFDLIFCLEVFEYVHDPVTAARNLAHWLAPGGTLHASFPFVYPQHEPLADDCLRYTRAGARRILELAGLEVDEIVARTALNEDALKGFYSGDGMRAAREGASHGEIGYIIRATKPLK